MRPIPSPKATSDLTQDRSHSVANLLGPAEQGNDYQNLSGAQLQGRDLSHTSFRDTNLNGANLSDSILDGVDLTGAKLAGANLRGTHLKRAILRGADLSSASLLDAILDSADLAGATLSGARLNRAHLAGAFLAYANLDSATLVAADLSGAILTGAKLTGAKLDAADADGAHFVRTRLARASLVGTHLQGASLTHAEVEGTIFEPLSLPDARAMASAVNIQKLTYHLTPDALTQLSSAFRSSGYYDQHRAVVYALRRADAAKLMQEWKLRHDPASLIAWLFNSLLFDATCQYGMNRARPLWGLGISWLTFSIIYLLVINRADGPGVYIVTSRTPNREHRYRLKARTVLAGSPWLHPLAVLRSQSRAAATAMLFSAMSAFNIGFKEIDFGRWIRLLMPAEFDLKPTGWVRSVAGVQSLISLYLLALWVLAYFGAPFD